MKGREMARTVRINQDGCAIIRHLRFFLNLEIMEYNNNNNVHPYKSRIMWNTGDCRVTLKQVPTLEACIMGKKSLYINTFYQSSGSIS